MDTPKNLIYFDPPHSSYNKYSLHATEREIQCKICITNLDSNKKWVNINYDIYNITAADKRGDIVDMLKNDAKDIYMKLNGISNLIHSQKKRQEYSLSSINTY